ncbi:olfactory receptor 140-like [Betta splendens]|uniref:Olfactory receptor n=1 Tax=Betta splendens TaxID=158456 RepID=A0A6P7P1S7_BETSP|nr:olfactory receptor 140-like [Betta splendens]
MINSTQFSYIILSAYADIKLIKYIFFMIFTVLYFFIICANMLLIVVICLNRSLHEPMYMFLCSLFVNELFGSSGLFPFLLIQFLSDVHHISNYLCFLQIFCVYSYAGVEFYNLAVMSYDRYVAICFPLQYKTRMTNNMVIMLIVVSWLPPLLMVTGTTMLSFSLQLCGNVINKVYCDNYSVVKLACFDTSVNNIYGLIVSVGSIICALTLIFYTYIKIFKVCFSGSSETREKAVNTCSPHLASLLNFSFGCLFEVSQSRFNMSNVPTMLGIFLSIYYFTCQPLFNPVLYGLKMSKIRNTCKHLLKKR